MVNPYPRGLGFIHATWSGGRGQRGAPVPGATGCPAWRSSSSPAVAPITTDAEAARRFYAGALGVTFEGRLLNPEGLLVAVCHTPWFHPANREGWGDRPGAGHPVVR